MASNHQITDDEAKTKHLEELRAVIETYENQTINHNWLDNDIDFDDDFLHSSGPLGPVTTNPVLSTPESLPSNTLNDPAVVPSEINEWLVSDPKTGKMRPPRQCEFLRLVVDNPQYVSYASWSSKEKGLVEIHQPIELIALWRKVKGRQTDGPMNYDTFARGFRTYYKDGSMIRTYKRHTFCFNLLTSEIEQEERQSP